jgi:hypothetical protein
MGFTIMRDNVDQVSESTFGVSLGSEYNPLGAVDDNRQAEAKSSD